MANHKSALKRAKQSEIRRMRNRMVKTRVKNLIKAVRAAVDENPDTAVDIFQKAQSYIAKAAKRGVIHRNAASRKIARLARLFPSAEAAA